MRYGGKRGLEDFADVETEGKLRGLYIRRRRLIMLSAALMPSHPAPTSLHHTLFSWHPGAAALAS